MHEIKKKARLILNHMHFLGIYTFILILALSADASGLKFKSAEIEASETLARHVLNGTVVSKDKHSCVALVKDDRTGENLILKTGETLDKFNLVQILEDRIVFQKNEETYHMFLGRSGIYNANQKEGTKSISEMAIQCEEEAIQPPEDRAVTKEFSRSYLEQRILAEWKMILDQIQISPHILEGQVRGFQLTKIPKGSLLSEIGLQKDDIILEINGEELKDKAFIISLIDRFKNDDHGEMTIKRNGKLFRFQYILN